MRALLATMALAALAAGCGPDVTVQEDLLRKAAPKAIAVLPFTLAQDDLGPRAELKAAAIREAVLRHCARLSYLHLETHETDRLLARAGLGDRRALARASAREIGEALGVDALVRGEVTALSNIEAGLFFRQRVAATVRLVDARTGADLARIDHAESDTGGLALESSQSVTAIARRLDNSSDVGFLALAERLAERIAKALPPPPVRPEVTQPAIAGVEVVAGADAELSAGGAVEVLVTAGPGLEAALDLTTRLAEIPMWEEAPGRYRGFYRAATGDEAVGPISVHVSDRFGTTAARVVEGREVRIRARPPGALRALRATAEGGGRVRLAWGAPEGPAPAAYRVYRVDAVGRPIELERTAGGALGAVVPAGEARAYAVAAEDARGNVGALAIVEAPKGGAR